MGFVKLITCLSIVEAHLIKGHLESENIQCVLQNENFAYLQPNLNAIHGSGPCILVLESDFKRAKELIETDMEGEVDDLEL